MSNLPRACKRFLALCEPEMTIMTVEDIQAMIRAIVIEDCYRVRHAASLGKRNKYPTPTPEVVLAVRRDKIENEKLPEDQQVNDAEIGLRHGIMVGGRVNEILYRDHDGEHMYDVNGVRIKQPVRPRRRKVVDVEDLM